MPYRWTPDDPRWGRADGQALEVAEHFATYDRDEQDMTMLALAVYEVSEDYEEWRRRCAFEENEETHQYYQLILASYMAVWKKLGSREFFERLDAAKRQLTIIEVSKS